MTEFIEARQIAEQYVLALGLQLLDDKIVEKPFGWYFMAQSPKFIESGDWQDTVVGFAGIVVDRNDGHVFQLTTPYRIEDQLDWYANGYRFRAWNLAIRRVNDYAAAVDALLKVGLTYVVPEVAYGRTWRVPQRYKAEQLRELLTTLPVEFKSIGLTHEAYFALRRSNAMSVELIGLILPDKHNR